MARKRLVCILADVPESVQSPYPLNHAWIYVLFLVVLALTTGLQLWLSLRHMRHVKARAARCRAFSDRIPLSDHQKAADYTIRGTRFTSLKR